MHKHRRTRLYFSKIVVAHLRFFRFSRHKGSSRPRKFSAACRPDARTHTHTHTQKLSFSSFTRAYYLPGITNGNEARNRF